MAHGGCLVTEAEDILLHTLGLNHRGAVSTRNHFAGEPPEMAKLVAAGLMEKVSNGNEITGGEPVFRATVAGRARALEIQAREYPKPSRSQARYEQWLDSESGMKFGEWLKMGCYKADFEWPRRSIYADLY